MIGWKKRPRTDYIVIHCSKTHPEELDEEGRPFDVVSLERRNMIDGAFVCSYHWVIDRNGVTFGFRPEDIIGNHCPGVNSVSVAVCLLGGKNKAGETESNYTPAQWESLRQLTEALLRKYPDAEVVGHNNVSAVETTCPSFDVKGWHAVLRHRHAKEENERQPDEPAP